jgi:protein-S-isoprenylcysteine O-methyltransferase Ste14
MIRRILIQNTIWLIILSVILFVSADDWSWPQGWAFIILNAVGAFGMSFWLLRRDPALLEQRMSSPMRKDQRPRDRLLIAMIGVVYLGWIVTMGVDGHRFAVDTNPLWGQALGLAAIIGCFVLVMLAFRANSFAVPQVRVQAERAQTVISNGPYAYVRHPMYSGALLLFVGGPMLLGSQWALVGSALLIAGLVLRILGEERVLLRDLPGYEAYTQKVKFRLFPGLW